MRKQFIGNNNKSYDNQYEIIVRHQGIQHSWFVSNMIEKEYFVFHLKLLNIQHRAEHHQHHASNHRPN